MNYVTEPEKNVPVVRETDICVLGGSCTGVFAAVRAARLGARTVIVEKQNAFGGVAASGFVNIWHSLYDTSRTSQIIGGLTHEVLDRLDTRNSLILKHGYRSRILLNTEELKIELDELVSEAEAEPMLHCWYAAPFVRDGNLEGVFVENKSGRGVIRAKVFIDATGDGDLCAHLGIACEGTHRTQPPGTGAKMTGTAELGENEYSQLLAAHGEEFGLEKDWGWQSAIPGVPGVAFHSDTHVHGVNCADATDLTAAEIEGRRQVRAVMDLLRTYSPDTQAGLAGLGSYIGVRETRHIQCAYTLTEEDVLTGRRFDDAIANGTYPVDIHHDSKPGITIKQLNGTQHYLRYGHPDEVTRWRPEQDEDPPFYQIPFRCLLPEGEHHNLIAAGRMIGADRGAYGAVRVMVNMNQTGEAAGAAAFLSLEQNIPVSEIQSTDLRKTLKSGGSTVC